MIRIARFAMVVVLAVLVLQCTSFAQGAPVFGNKYIQAPKLTADSWDFSSEVKRAVTGAPVFTSLMADDWKCPDGKPITDIHWWGSYWYKPGAYINYSNGCQDAPNAQGVQGFTVKIYSDIPVGPGVVYSRPGQELWSKTFQGNANESLVTTIDKGSGLFETVYKYDILLGQSDWFQQEKDVIYWLSVQANFDATDRQWGWHETNQHVIDYAVQVWDGSNWIIPCSGHDMAFQLTTVPEPASLMALGLGVIGLGGMISRRRRK